MFRPRHTIVFHSSENQMSLTLNLLIKASGTETSTNVKSTVGTLCLAHWRTAEWFPSAVSSM